MVDLQKVRNWMILGEYALTQVSITCIYLANLHTERHFSHLRKSANFIGEPRGGSVSLHIINTNAAAQTIMINSLKLDSITFAPQNVLTNICSEDAYHYGFNGQMKDNEWAGTGNHLDFGAWGYGPREARFPAPDGHANKHPNISPYAFAANSPNIFVDYDGNDFGECRNILQAENG